MMGKLVWLSIVSSAAACALACSVPTSNNKTPLIVCEAGEKGCPSEDDDRPSKTTTKQDNPGPSSPPVTVPEEQDEPKGGEDDPQDPPEDEGTDAGKDTGPKEVPLGPICTALQACCGQLKEAGYSPATCEEMVATKSENACSLQHKQYKDFGDCS